MPELPEVETIMRGLEPVLVGSKIEMVETRRPNLRFPFPERFNERLAGNIIEKLDRRAKYILAYLSSQEVLVLHLGMTGKFTIFQQFNNFGIEKQGTYTDANEKHDHVLFILSDGTKVKYNDARRFGFMTLIEADKLEDHDLFRHLGVEPLGNRFDETYLARTAHRKSSSIKSFLLDQSVVAGLGNIYVCEALFRAGISPKRHASCLSTAGGGPSIRAERLAGAIRSVLSDAIAAGGSTLRDHRKTDGSLGYFQHLFSVYGREGKSCCLSHCAGSIRRIVQTGRSTFYCSNCQR